VIDFSKSVTKFSLYWVAFFLIGLGLWINKNFGQPSFEQLLYHLQLVDGLVKSDQQITKSFILSCIVYHFIMAILIHRYKILILALTEKGLIELLTLSKNLLKFAKYQ